MDDDLLGEAERAVAAWVVGDADATTALEQACASVESSTTSMISLVVGEASSVEVVNAPVDGRVRLAVARAAERAGPNRALTRDLDRDGGWSAVWEEPDSASPAATTGAWIACEPVSDADGLHHGSLVAHGSGDATLARVLVVLPELARLAAAVLGRERARAVTAKVTHSLNNLLAGVLANVEYAGVLIEGASPDAPLLVDATPAVRAEFVMALLNAEVAARQLGHHVAEIGKLTRSRRSK